MMEYVDLEEDVFFVRCGKCDKLIITEDVRERDWCGVSGAYITCPHCSANRWYKFTEQPKKTEPQQETLKEILWSPVIRYDEVGLDGIVFKKGCFDKWFEERKQEAMDETKYIRIKKTEYQAYRTWLLAMENEVSKKISEIPTNGQLSDILFQSGKLSAYIRALKMFEEIEFEDKEPWST